ncbi:MAG TPA: carbamate kinase [Acidobacteriota bacterium]|nr:carbamate kinase [Acidobacteriota bacterium]
MPRSALIAVGGNSLIRAGEKGTIAEQINNARLISRAVAAFLAEGFKVVLTHGNGPQVGAALLRSERAAGQVYELGLDVCVAATQGEIGYILQQALQQEIKRAGLPQSVMTVLTQVIVSADDPAFLKPTKPIGPFYSRESAEERTHRFGWQIVEDSYRGYRRVVSSPEPLEIVEEDAIRRVFQQGILAVALGGGGIPVVRENGTFKGVDAVIDKDRSSVLLALRLPVDLLIFPTDADFVYLNFKRPDQRALMRVSAGEIRAYHEAGHFPPGSMGPKIEASLRFLSAGGKEVIITSLEKLASAARGEGGTHILACGE